MFGFRILPRRRARLTIIYKSGAVVHARAREFNLTKNAHTTEMNWVRMSPRPLMIGVDEIAAVYEGHA